MSGGAIRKTRGRKTHEKVERNTHAHTHTQRDQMSQSVLGSHVLSTCSFRTWAERVARQLLDALTFADGATVERGGVGAAARAFLVTPATAAVAHGPLCPRGPSSVNWGSKH